MVNNKEKNFISAVIYVNNNEKTIKNLLTKINTFLFNNFDKYEIICVNDASKDNSVKIIKQFSQSTKTQKISIINMSYYQGIEQSMEAGVDLAIGDFVYEFDNNVDDFDENVIKSVYEQCLKGYDIVSASSNGQHNIASSIFYKVFNKHANLQYDLQTETFRLLSRRAINRVNSISHNIPYRKAIYAKCGLKMFNLKYKSVNDEKRKISKEIHENRKNTAINSLILFTNVGYKVSFTMSMLMLMITVLVALYTIIIFFSKNPIQGWTTTMLFLSFGFFGLFLLITVAIKYLDVLVELSFKKNKYLIEGIEKIN